MIFLFMCLCAVCSLLDTSFVIVRVRDTCKMVDTSLSKSFNRSQHILAPVYWCKK